MLIIGLAAVAALGRSPIPSVSSQDLVEVTDISSLADSPDGQFVAFRTAQPSIGDNRIHLRWYVVPADGSAPARMIADGGGPEIDSGVVLDQVPVWAPSSRAVYFRAEFDGETQIWRASIDGTTPRQVTRDAADVQSLALANDGRSLDYMIGATRDAIERAERDARDNGVLIDGSVDVTSPLTLNGTHDGHAATLRFDHGWFHRRPLLWDQPLRTSLLPLDQSDLTGIGQPLSQAKMTVRIDVANEQSRLHAMDLNGADRLCSAKACLNTIIEAAAPMPNGRDVLVTTRDIAFREALSVWTPVTGRWRTLAQGDGQLESGSLVGDKSCSVTWREALCVAASAGSPPRLLAIDLARGTMTTLFDPNSLLRPRAWPARTLFWTTAAGLPASGQLLLPKGAKPKQGYPLVINYYSCPGFLKGGLGDELPLAPLAQAGIATLCINEVRGPRPTERIAEDRAIDAISTIINRLEQQGLVDGSRIGMAGLSFGSGVVLAVAERTRLLRAAAISSGQIEPYYYWAFRLPGLDIREELQNFYGVGDPDTDKLGWKTDVPVGAVGAIKAPLLIQIPESEMRITVELYSKLAASTTPAEMIAYPNETHDKWEPRHKLAVYDRNLDWFRFWLVGEIDPDPAKVEQYRRWREYSGRPGYSLPVEDKPAPKLGIQ
jgi:dipeptidyl aminopeptidase/acylaminoacyl peptidase